MISGSKYVIIFEQKTQRICYNGKLGKLDNDRTESYLSNAFDEFTIKNQALRKQTS